MVFYVNQRRRKRKLYTCHNTKRFNPSIFSHLIDVAVGFSTHVFFNVPTVKSVLFDESYDHSSFSFWILNQRCSCKMQKNKAKNLSTFFPERRIFKLCEKRMQPFFKLILIKEVTKSPMISLEISETE